MILSRLQCRAIAFAPAARIDSPARSMVSPGTAIQLAVTARNPRFSDEVAPLFSWRGGLVCRSPLALFGSPKQMRLRVAKSTSSASIRALRKT